MIDELPDLSWRELEERFEWIASLFTTPQDPVFHAEGDVGIHTRMALEWLVDARQFRELPERERAIVFAAVLFHDRGKIAMTKTEPDGRISSRGHSALGEQLARTTLWHAGEDFGAREHVASLVRYHQIPFFLVDRPDARRLAIRVSQTTRCDWLALVAEADALGRKCVDQKKIADNVALFVEFCREQRCLSASFEFANDCSRFLWFRNPERDPDYAAHDETRSRVTLLSGLPGSGKNTWIAANAADRPIVSLDAIRSEIDVDPEDAQGPVIQTARERARIHLRKGEPFIWNATNVSRQLRSGLISFFAEYGARVRIVYVETSEPQLRRRARDRSVPTAVIDRLIEKWSVPDLTEAHAIDFVLR
jgi:predicted kinase